MNPLMRRTAARQRTRIRAEAPAVRDEDGVVSLRLYDPLDSWGEFWGVSAREFVAVLDEVPRDTTEIHLLINSPGGEVWEGLAILNALRAHPARVVAVVEGIAASSASFIAAGVDELAMAQNSELFVHRAWAIALGNAEDLERAARDLTHEDRNLASIYARKAGTDVDTWLAAMGEETWYSAEEAVEVGLADRVLDEDGSANVSAAKARFDLSVLASRSTRSTTAAPARGGPTEGSRAVAFTDDQMTSLRQLAGVGEDADEQTVLDALGEALGEANEPDGGEGPGEGAPPAAAGEQAAARLPAGVSAIDAATLADLQNRAARGDQARAEQEVAARNALVDAAVRDGRIPPARAEAWNALLTNDPGAADTLAGMAKGTVPVEAKGRDDAPESDDALYNKLFGDEKKASA